MKKYLYSEICENCVEHGKPIPEDVNDYVIEYIMPILDKFPEIKEDALKLIKNQSVWDKFTGQHRAVIPHPNILTLPLVAMEFHNGVIKRFTFAKFFGMCYFPENHKNEKVIFDHVPDKYRIKISR